MKNVKFLLVVLITLFGFINIAVADSVPQYADYATAVMCKKAKPLTLDFTGNKQAATYRTILRAAAKQEPNFAGHYILTSWGCGTGCLQLGIIDDETGKVYMPTINNPAWDNYQLLGWSYETPRADSKLLVINAQLTTKAGAGKFRNVKAYYKWENNELVLLQ